MPFFVLMKAIADIIVMLLRLPATWLLVQDLVHANNKEIHQWFDSQTNNMEITSMSLHYLGGIGGIGKKL